MFLILSVLLFLCIALIPQFYVKKILSKYRKRHIGTNINGFQFGAELLEQNGVRNITVLKTDMPDHYDPILKEVKLSPSNYQGSDLTSLIVAAHEVGHAIQDYTGFRPLSMRTNLAKWSIKLQKFGSVFMMGAPLLIILTRNPRIGAISIFLGVAGFISNSLINLITLPVELDASFNRALPLIEKRREFSQEDQKAAREILRACAFTYLAASLSDFLNIMRWLAILRRR